ncbi:MAG: tetratricopeptide repeat protein [Terriglobales bacterium]
MKKLLVAFVLALFSVAAAEPFPQESAPSQKVIKDPAEHNAYVGAVSQQDPNARISGLEGFLAQYPGTVMKEESLEALMGAYQQAGNPAKSVEAAERVLLAGPNNLRALALLAYTKRASAEAGQNPQQNAAEARKHGESGLRALESATKPEGVSDADFQNLKKQTANIFNGAVGFGALQTKDFPAAQKHLRSAVEASPNNIQDVWPLSMAYLEVQPIDPNGLWFVARAINLSNSQPQIAKYGRGKYMRYHGGEDGWKELLAQTKTSGMPPDGFTIKPAPTDEERAATMVASKTIKEMNFAEFEFILGVGGEPGQKVWDQIKGVPLQFQGRVISATRNKLLIAATADAIDAKRPDVEVTMSAALTARQVPRSGADILLEATPAEFQQEPFVMKMEKGVLLTRAAPNRSRRR